MTQREKLEIEMAQGEDFVAQIYWTDEDGEPLKIQTPCRMEVRNPANQIILQFDTSDTGNTATLAALVITGAQGLMQISCPKTVSKLVAVGTYPFDLWATLDEGVAPFAAQLTKVAEGAFIVSSRTTIMEVAAV